MYIHTKKLPLISWGELKWNITNCPFLFLVHISWFIFLAYDGTCVWDTLCFENPFVLTIKILSCLKKIWHQFTKVKWNVDNVVDLVMQDCHQLYVAMKNKWGGVWPQVGRNRNIQYIYPIAFNRDEELQWNVSFYVSNLYILTILQLKGVNMKNSTTFFVPKKIKINNLLHVLIPLNLFSHTLDCFNFDISLTVRFGGWEGEGGKREILIPQAQKVVLWDLSMA